MDYKGFEYDPWYDRDSDGFDKIYHEVKDTGGNTIEMPRWFSNLSPYRLSSRDDFIKAIEEHIESLLDEGAKKVRDYVAGQPQNQTGE